MIKYKIKDDELTRLKWISRIFCKMTLEKYVTWRISFMEEDGGAYMRYPDKGFYEGKTLKEAVNEAWKQSAIESKIQDTLFYRDINYKDETDEELGIEELSTKQGSEGNEDE